MPRGQVFFKGFKQLAFSAIEFVESEQTDSPIPLYNVNQKLQSILQISERSIYRLKQEMKKLKVEEDKISTVRTSSGSSSSSSTTNIPITPSSPKKASCRSN